MFVEQSVAITFYTTISVFIYWFAGPLVSSPALGSANALGRKIAFGFALPTIVVAGVVNGSVACKYVYMRMWKGTNVVHQNSWKSLGSWGGICAGLWLVSWLLAEAVPNFNLLLGLIAALFGSWFSCECKNACGMNSLTRSRCPTASDVVLPAQRKSLHTQEEDIHDVLQCCRIHAWIVYCKF